MLAFTNSNIWNAQMDLNESFLELFDMIIVRVGILTLSTVIIFIWLTGITLYLLKKRSD